MIIGLFLVAGCGGDDGGPNPVTGVSITADRNSLEIGHSTGITATVSGGSSKSLEWFVNDIENGDAEFGTITEKSDVTYNAPDSLPSPRTVVIKAVSVEDTSRVDTCRVRIEFTKLFVDSATGDDDTATGCINLPYRTITRALEDAEPDMTVLVRPGTYSDAAGESYPFYIPGSVALVGEDWESCILQKETEVSAGSYAVMFVYAESALRKFTIRDRSDLGDPRWRYTIRVEENNDVIDSVRVLEHGRVGCIRIDGQHGGGAQNTIVQNCILNVEQDDEQALGSGRGFEIVFDDQGTILRNCRASGFYEAIFFNYSSDALVEGCQLINNRYGANLCCGNETSNPNPDFGGGARGSTGGNQIWANSECGLNNQGMSTVYARFNTWENAPPVEGEDFCNSGTGEIIVE
jgi:hypothetical protein